MSTWTWCCITMCAVFCQIVSVVTCQTFSSISIAVHTSSKACSTSCWTRLTNCGSHILAYRARVDTRSACSWHKHITIFTRITRSWCCWACFTRNITNTAGIWNTTNILSIRTSLSACVSIHNFIVMSCSVILTRNTHFLDCCCSCSYCICSIATRTSSWTTRASTTSAILTCWTRTYARAACSWNKYVSSFAG